MSFDAQLQGKRRGHLTGGIADNGNAYGRFELGLIHNKGDSFSATGDAAITIWAAQGGAIGTGLDVTVAAVMTAYHAARKRGDKPAPGVANDI